MDSEIGRLLAEELPRPWEDYLHFEFVCSDCEQVLRGTRHRCQECEDFDLCSACFEGSVHHTQHPFIHVQYRPISRPPLDGSDLALLERLREGGDDEDIATYYPWIISGEDFPEMAETCRETLVAMLIEPKADEGDEEALLQFRFWKEEASLDQLIRSVASGSLRASLEDNVDLLEGEIVRAKHSQELWKVFQILKQLVTRLKAVSRCGNGDASLTESATSTDQIMLLESIDADMNETINQQKLLQGVRHFVQQQETLKQKMDGFIHEKCIEPEISCLKSHYQLMTSIYSSLEQGTALEQSLVIAEHDVDKDICSYSEVHAKSKMIRALFQEQQELFQKLKDEDPVSESKATSHSNGCSQCRCCSQSENVRIVNEIAEATSMARQGHFQVAISRLESLAMTSANSACLAFYKMQILETQGYLSRAVDAGKAYLDASSCESDLICPENALVHLALSFLRLHTEGLWAEALAMAGRIFDRFLRGKWWLANRPNLPSLAWLELYYHRVNHFIRKDLLVKREHETEPGPEICRLRDIRQCLLALGDIPLAWEVLLVELKSWETPINVAGGDPPVFNPVRLLPAFKVPPGVAMEVIQTFTAALGNQIPVHAPSDYQDIEAYARLALAYHIRRADVHHNHENNGATAIMFHRNSLLERNTAAALFESTHHALGLLEIQLFDATQPGHNSEAELMDVYQKFEALDYLCGMRFIKELCLDFPWADQHASLVNLAERAGDFHSVWTHKLNALEGWFFAPVIISTCEEFFNSSGKLRFHSETLNAIATWNLAKSLATIGNIREAASNALTHYQILLRTGLQENISRARNLWLQCLSDLIDSISPPTTDIRLLCQLQHCLCYKTVQVIEFHVSTALPWTFKDLLRALDILLWFPCRWKQTDFFRATYLKPNTRASVQSEEEVEIKDEVLGMMGSQLMLAAVIMKAIPESLLPLVLGKLAHALGSVLTYCENWELAIHCFDLGIQVVHPSEELVKHQLQLQIGRLLNECAFKIPEKNDRIRSTARSLLSNAQAWFFSDTFHNESYPAGVAASVTLAASNLHEMTLLMKQNPNPAPDIADLVAKLYELGSEFAWSAKSMSYLMSHEMQDLSALRSLYNKRILFHHALLEVYHIHLALAMLIVCSLPEYPKHVGNVWDVVQAWKAISLSDILGSGYRVPFYLQKSINSDSKAIDLLAKEKDLALAIKTSQLNRRHIARKELLEHQHQMVEHPILRPLMSNRLMIGATWEDLNWISTIATSSEDLLPEGKSMIFIDWARCADGIIFLLVNSSADELQVYATVLDIKYDEVKEWYDKYLGVEHVAGMGKSRKRLESAVPLTALKPLIQPLANRSKFGDILVFCPAGVLCNIPLHAIPLEEDGEPLIARNPVVYCASNSVLRECVSRAEENKGKQGILKAALFGRYGQSDVEEQTQVRDAVIELSTQLGTESCSTVIEKDLTKLAFTRGLAGASLIHYHGHASIEQEDLTARNLVLEPDPETGDKGALSIADIFKLQLDPAPHMTILACASSEQDIDGNDDPLGILSAFLCAGASSVLGTLWPTQSQDARKFSKLFYANSFNMSQGDEDYVNLAYGLQDAVLHLRWERHEPYHWAPFVLHGAWFCASRHRTMSGED
ncbi:CHAT domain-containing protein [Kalaharituber pfeilii]|nr:CHAT domain-containing protein [Kalaharituber pfeilii]